MASGMGIRILAGGCSVFLSESKPDKETLKKKIRAALNSISRKEHLFKKTGLSTEPVYKKEYAVKQKKKTEDITVQEKFGLLKQIDDAAIVNQSKPASRYLALSDGVSERFFVNSEGSQILSRIPTVGIFYFVTVKGRRHTLQRAWQQGFSGGFERIEQINPVGDVKKNVDSMVRAASSGVKAPKGVLDVVTGPEITGIMVHESGGHPYEADRILGAEAAQAGGSFLTVKHPGTRIGSPLVSIADDPTIPNSFGFFLYDDEGVKARKKLLVKDGIVNGFLHNRETALKMGVRSNGSSRCSGFNRQPVVRMSNTFMLPGDQKEEELIEGVRRGIYIKNFMEWNIDDVRMSQRYVGGAAYLIRNGKIGAPVLNPVLEITTPALYSAIDGIADNLEFSAGTCGKAEPMQGVPVWMGGPSIRLKAVRFR